MNIDIRQAQQADLPYIYDICLRTGLSGKDASSAVSDKYMIGQYFAAPYIYYEIDLCFAVTGDYKPMGYIVGTSNSSAFYSWMNLNWLPQIRCIYPDKMPAASDFESFVINIIHKDCHLDEFLKDYPAHLHIDLLPQLQGKGVGKKLMSEFINKLKLKGSTGLHLSVGEKNLKAIKFYKKSGFCHLFSKSSAVFMGIKF